MTASTKDLIAELRYNANSGTTSSYGLEQAAADALERLTEESAKWQALAEGNAKGWEACQRRNERAERLTQPVEEIEALSAGRPLGDIVGLHTAQNALAEVDRLTAELAEAKQIAEVAEAGRLHACDLLEDQSAILAELRAQEPVEIHQWRRTNGDGRWRDATKEEAYSRVDSEYEARTLYARPIPAAQAVPEGCPNCHGLGYRLEPNGERLTCDLCEDRSAARRSLVRGRR